MNMQKTTCGTVALVGAPNAGKSTLLNALLGEKIAPISPKPQTTRRQLRGVLTRGSAQMVFVDTPGMLKPGYELQGYMQQQAVAAFEEVDVVVFVVDASLSLQSKMREATEMAFSTLIRSVNATQPVLLVLNKIDQLQDKAALLPIIYYWQDRRAFTGIIPISALKKDGVKELEKEVTNLLPHGDFIFSADVFTDATERDLVAEMIREKVMQQLGDEVPYQVAVTVEEFDESRREEKKKPLVSISAIIHVERDSQKPILIGKQGSRLKALGTAARKDIENLLGCQVMLKLFVRVEPEWSKSAKSMRKLGYTH